MKALIDTHVLIWFLTEPERLSKGASAFLDDPANDVLVSAVSAQGSVARLTWSFGLTR